MKTLLRFVVLALAPMVLPFWASITPAHSADKLEEAANLTIEKVSYGTEEGRIEVAELFRPLLAHGILFLRAPWGLGNPDPKPGTVKDVVIVYRHNGARETATFTQRQDIILPPPAKGLTIIRALYGLGDSRLDVTDAVRAAAKDDTLRLPPKWSFGRVDPAAGKIKTVEITYLFEGLANTVFVSQNDPLALP